MKLFEYLLAKTQVFVTLPGYVYKKYWVHKRVNIQLGTLFAPPHENIRELQQDVARVLLCFIGVDYLPGRLIKLLNRFDAFQAVRKFLAEIEFDYDTLLKNESERALFQELVEVLAEADTLYKSSIMLSDVLLYEAVATHNLDAVKVCLSTMRKAVSAATPRTPAK